MMYYLHKLCIKYDKCKDIFDKLLNKQPDVNFVSGNI